MTVAQEPSEPIAPAGAAEKMSDSWSRTLPVSDPPDAKFGEWRVWVDQGWLVAERRTGNGDIEWKIVLAKVVGDEVPEIVVARAPVGARMVRRVRKEGELVTTALSGPTGPMPGSLRLSYRDGRYFIRDGFPYLRSLRQAKSGDDTWPKLDVPPPDAQGFGAGMAATRAAVLSGQVSNSWLTVVAGPQGGMRQVNQRVRATIAADGLVRLTHKDLREAGDALRFSGGGDVAAVTLGDWYLLDDGELLVAKKLDAWQLPNALNARAQRDPAFAARLARERLVGQPPPELSGGAWLNAEKPPTWETLKGHVVLLVLFDLKQQAFAPLVAPLLGFEETYGQQGLKVIGVYANGPRDEIEKHLTENRIKFPVLIDHGKTAERYGLGYSGCVLIDREGKVVAAYKDSLAPPAEIEKLLEAKE